MRSMTQSRGLRLSIIWGLSVLHCSPDPAPQNQENDSVGGALSADGGQAADSGGAPSGGAPSGGASSTGGAPAAGGGDGTGAVLQTGGTAATGGTFGSGGEVVSSVGGAAGTGGAPITGSGGSMASSATCDNPAWTFCDDFESYSVGDAPDGGWYEASDLYGNPVIATSGERSFSGASSVNFRVNSGGGRAFLNTDVPFPAAGDVFYGRMMIFMESVPASAHWDIISAYGDGGVCEGNYRWGGQSGHTLANYHPGDCYQHFGNLVPEEGKWLCYEWKFDAPLSEMHVWIDDFEMNDTNHAVLSGSGQGCANAGSCPPNPHPGQQWVAPEWAHLSIGWAHYQSEEQAPNTWIDDVVIDDERIGCPAMPF